MSVTEFEDLTPSEFIAIYNSWACQQESKVKTDLTNITWAVWVLTSIQLEKKDRKSRQEMFPLPWEQQETDSVIDITDEERLKRVKEMLKMIPDENS